jgi:HAD superfamily phosphatase (TIGR01668 family)
MFRFLAPHLQVESVLDLGVDRLRRLDLDALLLDVDCTLKSYRSEAVGAEVAGWLGELRAAGIGLCLLSNGREKRIRQFAEKLKLPFVAGACKPLPFGCRRAVRKMGFDGKRTAVVGDQLFADVMAGRLAGLRSILVRPIQPEQEPWYTRLKRPLERLLLRWMDSRSRDRGRYPGVRETEGRT